MGEDQAKWYNGQLAAGVIAGLIVGTVLWLVPLVYTEATKVKVPGWVYLVIVAVGILVATVAVPLWRRKVWGWVPRSARWLRGLRVTTAAQRARLATRTRATISAKPLVAIATPLRASTRAHFTIPMTKERRLEIIDHKAQQIIAERQILQQMKGRSTDTKTINEFLDAKADLDDREQILNGERRAIELLDEKGNKVLPRPNPPE